MKLDTVHARLRKALRSSDTLPRLRQCVAELAVEIETDLEADAAPDTVRAPTGYPPPWEDAAPSVPHDSEAGREYGV